MKEHLQPLFSLLRTIQIPWTLLVITMVLTLIETGAGLWVPLLTRDLIDGAGSGQTGDTLTLLVVVLIGQAGLSAVSLYLLCMAAERLTAYLRNRLFHRLVHLPMSFHDQNDSGELVSRTISDTTTLQDLLTQQLVSFVSGLVSMVGAIIILWLLDWQLTLVLFTTVLASLLLILPVTTRLQAIGKDIQDTTASFSARLTSLLGDMRLVKASCAERQECDTAAGWVEKLRGLGLKEARVYALLGPAVTMAISGALVIILGYGGSRVANGALAVGTLVAFILYLFQVVMPMVQFSEFFAALNRAAGAAGRLGELLNEPVEDQKEEGESVGEPQSLHLRDVHFSYQTDEPILRGFDLEIPVGKVTALVGPSGSGKTTVFSLLERLYHPENGQITHGNQPLQDLQLETWRRRIGYVTQEAPLLRGTVRENLCYGLAESPEPQQIEHALRAARALDFVEELPQGLETDVGECGVKLSGGQRQRIAIARAFLTDPQVLMLDEATANLDAESEEVVRTALEELMAGRTTLIIAHRLATVINADQIAVVEEGRVTGTGTHQNLLQNHDLYRKLATGQRLEAGAI
jgi:ATP-binding cassette subfamily B protein AbcA/BmrA